MEQSSYINALRNEDLKSSSKIWLLSYSRDGV